MCDNTSRSTLLAQVAAVRHHLVAYRSAASNRRKMLCRTTSHNSGVGLSQQGPATVQYMKNPYADLAQRSQCSSSTRGTKDAIRPTARRQASARADASICVSPSPHSSRESCWCTVVEMSLAKGWPHPRLDLGSGVNRFAGVVTSEPPHLVAGRRTRTEKRGPLPCVSWSSRREALNFSLNSCLAWA
jgi:hypothetical protein